MKDHKHDLFEIVINKAISVQAAMREILDLIHVEKPVRADQRLTKVAQGSGGCLWSRVRMLSKKLFGGFEF